jgi:hypothetical protein
MAGNIPMVGFHDLMSVMLSGHNALVKLSHQDEVMMSFVIEQLKEIDSSFAGRIKVADTIKHADAVIATGSNNTSRYFEYYFSHIPHVIRKNRSSIAVLTGEESLEDLHGLADDIFLYFGLGCRNVSKIYIPDHLDLKYFQDAFSRYNHWMDFHKYANNYHYQKTVFLMNGIAFQDMDNLLLKPDEKIVSPLAVVYYQTYEEPGKIIDEIAREREQIQAVVGSARFIPDATPFGKAQIPELWDYADNFDTLEFLSRL